MICCCCQLLTSDLDLVVASTRDRIGKVVTEWEENVGLVVVLQYCSLLICPFFCWSVCWTAELAPGRHLRLSACCFSMLCVF